jgi:hypothetical protein
VLLKKNPELVMYDKREPTASCSVCAFYLLCDVFLVFFLSLISVVCTLLLDSELNLCRSKINKNYVSFLHSCWHTSRNSLEKIFA